MSATSPGFSSSLSPKLLPAYLVPNPGRPAALPKWEPPASVVSSSRPHPRSPGRPGPPHLSLGLQQVPGTGGPRAQAGRRRRLRRGGRGPSERRAARAGSGGSCRGRPGGARGAEGRARAPERTRVHTRHVCSPSHPPVLLGPAHTRAHSPENLACTSARGARCSPAPPGRPRPPPRRAALAPPAAPPLAFSGSQGSRARPPGLVAIATLVLTLTPPTHKAPKGEGKRAAVLPLGVRGRGLEIRSDLGTRQQRRDLPAAPASKETGFPKHLSFL